MEINWGWAFVIAGMFSVIGGHGRNIEIFIGILLLIYGGVSIYNRFFDKTQSDDLESDKPTESQ